MKLSGNKINRLIRKKKVSLNRLLQKAGVSKTAYYSLIHKQSVLPKSIHLLADALGVDTGQMLDRTSPEINIKKLIWQMNKICKQFSISEKENVWHTLLLLQEKPIIRLERALIRGRKINFH